MVNLRKVRLPIAFWKKKTAAVIAWRGANSRKCRLVFELRHKNCVALEHECGARQVQFDVVDRYKHMGTTKTANLGNEIVIRAAGVWAKTRKLREQLFAAADITREVKCAALRSCFILSQLFQAGAWPELSVGQYRTCHTALIRTYKLVCGDPYMLRHDAVVNDDDPDKHWMLDDEVICASEQVHPSVLLRVLRLLTSIRFAVKASWHFWCIQFAALKANNSWLHALHDDVRWLAATTSKFENLDVSSLAEWLKLAKRYRAQTAEAVKRVCSEEKQRKLQPRLLAAQFSWMR